MTDFHLEFSDDGLDWTASRQVLERWLLTEALRRSGGNQTKAARELGISNALVHKVAAKYGIDPRSFPVVEAPPESAPEPELRIHRRSWPAPG